MLKIISLYVNKGINMKSIFKKAIALSIVLPTMSYAALSLDRTRVIYNGDDNAVSMRIYNSSERLPFLGQTWFEDEKGNKIDKPFIATPPIQRIESKQQSQIKIQHLKSSPLPQDRESVFYFNFRQIPPKSDRPNVMQLTVQTKLKVFYRPSALFVSGSKVIDEPWQHKLLLKPTSTGLVAVNPTAYYITVAKISAAENSDALPNTEPFMVAPFSELPLNFKINQAEKKPFVTYINDFGGKKAMPFQCTTQCEIVKQ